MSAPLGVILAAGRGTRLGAIARRRPKCLTPLGGRTLLDWQRAAFDGAGLSRRVLLVGDPATGIRARPGETIRAGRPDGGPMDSLFALPAAERAGGVLASYGDIVYPSAHLQALAACDADIAIVVDRGWQALWSLRFGDRLLDDAERFRFDGARVACIGGRAATAGEIEAQFIGLLKLSARGCERLAACRHPGDDCTTLLARVIAAGGTVHAVAVDGGWCEVDSQQDLARYRGRLRARAPWSHDWRAR